MTPVVASTDESRRALIFVFALVAIDMIGFGIVMPVMPALIVELTGQTIAEAARDAGWLAFTYALLQFVFSPIIGNLSDRFGRRPVLMAALLAYSINYALMGLAPTLIWLFIGRAIAGITGASFSAAYAYVADISPPERRAQNFGLIGLAFGIGFIVGPAIGGLLGEYDTRLPFFAAGALALLNAAYGFFFLKESLRPENRRPFSLRRSHAIGALMRFGSANPAILWLAAALLAWQTGHHAFPTIWSFFAIERLGWSEFDIGLSLAAVGITSALVQGGLIRYVVPRIGEIKAILLGLAAMITAYTIYAMLTHGWQVYLAIGVGALGGLVYPSINGLMSQLVQSDSQGELQGAVASLTSLSTIIGPPVMAQVFGLFSSPWAPIYLPGAPFALSAILALISLVCIVVGARRAVSESRTA